MPTDEQILITMTMVYRKANQMQFVAAAYAAASAACPKDGNLMRGVFANHVRHVYPILHTSAVTACFDMPLSGCFCMLLLACQSNGKTNAGVLISLVSSSKL